MGLRRRDFINRSVIAAGAGIVTGFSSFRKKDNNTIEPILLPNDIPLLSPMPKGLPGLPKRSSLWQKKIEAVVIDSGTTLMYFTGVSWWPSERTFVAIIPAKGDIKYVCPAFEEDRFRELLKIGKDVYVWQEDESPYKLIATALKDSGIKAGKIGMEERLRFLYSTG